MTKYIRWIAESNRPKHIVVGFIVGFILGIWSVLAVSAAAEFKDWMWTGQKGGWLGWVKGYGFDWLDLLATMIGGALGCLTNYLVFNVL